MSDRDGTWCNCQLRRFPNDEFRSDPDYGVVHYKNVAREHTTLGEYLDPEGLPAMPEIEPDDAL